MRTSRLTARIDNNAAIVDGFQIYLHSFVVTRDGEWAIVPQGMNEGMRRPWRPAAAPPLVRFRINAPRVTESVAMAARLERRLALSPDGTQIVYEQARDPLMLQRLDRLEATPVQGTAGATAPFFSPDGRWIGHYDSMSRELRKVAVAGGSPATICRTPRPVAGANWADDDTIVFAAGEFRLVRTGTFPSYSPDGRHIVDTDSSARISELDLPAESRMFVVNADGSDRRVLFESAAQSPLGSTWSPRGDLIAFGFGDNRRGLRTTGRSQIAVIAPDGSGLRRVTPDDETNYHFPDWSPDGTPLVLRVASAQFKTLAILDVDSGRVTPLLPTPEGRVDNLAKWSPKGDLIAFTSNRDGDYDIFVMRADGSDVRRLTDDAAEEGTATFAWK